MRSPATRTLVIDAAINWINNNLVSALAGMLPLVNGSLIGLRSGRRRC